MPQLSRRSLLRAAGAAMLVPGISNWSKAGQQRRPKVAVLITAFFPRSHAHVILENFLEPYLFNGKVVRPLVEVVSLYVEQFPANDMARDVAAQYGLPIYSTIAEGLCCGGNELAVDAVLAIGEHGNYPTNEFDQQEYPRKRVFDESVAVFRRSGRCVPYFNDKHLSYRFDWAQEMVETARTLGFPLMAGSSVPLAQRKPPLELPAGRRVVEGVAIHSGPLERYDFHALENLQSLIESRAGGETGVARVEFLDTDALWSAAARGRWNQELALAAMQAHHGPELTSLDEFRPQSHGILIEYRDGARGTILRFPGSHTRWPAAVQFEGDSKLHATCFNPGPWNHRNLFKALSHAIQQMFVTGTPSYPVERTFLTTGILDVALHSRVEKRPLETPQLDVTYQTSADWHRFREMGASWEIITDETPERPGMAPLGEAQIPG